MKKKTFQFFRESTFLSNLYFQLESVGYTTLMEEEWKTSWNLHEKPKVDLGYVAMYA
jgi:hypothetical protein